VFWQLYFDCDKRILRSNCDLHSKSKSVRLIWGSKKLFIITSVIALFTTGKPHNTTVVLKQTQTEIEIEIDVYIEIKRAET
jgi:hypothetical protein